MSIKVALHWGRNGVGSRFRPTIYHMGSGAPENDSRPLSPDIRDIATIWHSPGGPIPNRQCFAGTSRTLWAVSAIESTQRRAGTCSESTRARLPRFPPSRLRTASSFNASLAVTTLLTRTLSDTTATNQQGSLPDLSVENEGDVQVLFVGTEQLLGANVKTRL